MYLAKKNDFHCAITCLKTNHVSIYRAQCLDKVTLKVLRTCSFHYNTEEKAHDYKTHDSQIQK